MPHLKVIVSKYVQWIGTAEAKDYESPALTAELQALLGKSRNSSKGAPRCYFGSLPALYGVAGGTQSRRPFRLSRASLN
jgi:hypothetical protein